MKREIHAIMKPDGKYRVFVNGKCVSNNADHEDVSKLFAPFKMQLATPPFTQLYSRTNRPTKDSEEMDISAPECENLFEELSEALDIIELGIKYISDKNKEINSMVAKYDNVVEKNKELEAEVEKYKAIAENAESRLATVKRLEDIIKNVMQEKGNDTLNE